MTIFIATTMTSNKIEPDGQLQSGFCFFDNSRARAFALDLVYIFFVFLLIGVLGLTRKNLNQRHKKGRELCLNTAS